jgi:hypothetical protein
MPALRFDLVFSYWIYAWYLLYAFNIFTSYSPKFALLLGLIENTIMLILMLLYGTSKETIFYFVLINALIKGLPLYYLIGRPIHLKDIYFTGCLFVLFIIWLHINKQSLVGNMKIVYESLLYGRDQTPFMSLLKKVFKNYKIMEMA